MVSSLVRMEKTFSFTDPRSQRRCASMKAIKSSMRLKIAIEAQKPSILKKHNVEHPGVTPRLKKSIISEMEPRSTLIFLFYFLLRDFSCAKQVSHKDSPSDMLFPQFRHVPYRARLSPMTISWFFVIQWNMSLSRWIRCFIIDTHLERKKVVVL